MKYATYMPGPALSTYIRCYWTLESDGNLLPGKERVFPDGCTELVFHFGGLFRKYSPGGEPALQPRSFVHGQIRSYIELEATGAAGIFAIRFEPSGLHAFVDPDIRELNDLSVSVEDLWGAAGKELEERLFHASSSEERIYLAERFLLRKLSGKYLRDQHKRTEYCVRTILASGGNVDIRQLAESLYVGKRQLERQFAEQVGLPPKLLARIVRFQQTLQMLEEHPRNLTFVAHERGFYDQAHFIRDFRDLTGMSPGAYFRDTPELARHLTGT